MKKLFTLLLALVATTALWAEDFSVGGIYYNILTDKTNEVEVTHRGSYSYDAFKYSGSVTIPKTVTYNGTTYSVTSIGEDAFYKCSGLTSITIPNSVTSIGEHAFNGCSALTSITIPNSVTSIGYRAFYQCSGLTSVTIPNSVMKIGKCAFEYCSGLTSVTIPNSVMKIGESAFDGCSGLTSVVWNAENHVDFSSYSSSPFYDIRSQITSFTFGDSVQHIPAYLCYEMSKLTSITIPNSVTSIGKCAFAWCSGLTSITIPNSVTSIGELAFDGCSGLTSVVWNAENCADFSSTSYAPFYDVCSQITSFTFGDSVQHIPTYLCEGMSKLTSITIPNSVTSIGADAFCYCSSLTSVTILNSVTSIGNNAFRVCWSLTSVTIGSGVTSIGDFAFYSCSSLTSITIPNSVTSIGNSAFESCRSLTSIKSLAEVPPALGGDAFYYVSKKIPVYVPCSSVSAYQSAEGWKDFTNIQCMPEDESAVDNVHSQSTNVQKIIRDGQLLIIRDGKTYNAQGAAL